MGANLQDLSATACLDYSSKTGAGHFPKAPKTRLHRGLPIEVQSGPDADIESMILMLLNLPSLRCPITIARRLALAKSAPKIRTTITIINAGFHESLKRKRLGRGAKTLRGDPRRIERINSTSRDDLGEYDQRRCGDTFPLILPPTLEIQGHRATLLWIRGRMQELFLFCARYVRQVADAYAGSTSRPLRTT